MNFEISFDEATRITRIDMRGEVTYDRMIEALDALTAGGDFLSERRLWDTSRTTGALTSTEMERIAGYASARDIGAGRVAIVATRDVVYGLSRVFEVYRESETVQVGVFRDAEDAIRWLQEGGTA